ncbi:MAG: hypothetical protein INQ03_10530 [Candidatus Heimdallarchaeota archaeon]|nr:hypothetical protein [Candidatus Heimdallarchaeota archaeon]
MIISYPQNAVEISNRVVEKISRYPHALIEPLGNHTISFNLGKFFSSEFNIIGLKGIASIQENDNGCQLEISTKYKYKSLYLGTFYLVMLYLLISVIFLYMTNNYIELRLVLGTVILVVLLSVYLHRVLNTVEQDIINYFYESLFVSNLSLDTGYYTFSKKMAFKFLAQILIGFFILVFLVFTLFSMVL